MGANQEIRIVVTYNAQTPQRCQVVLDVAGSPTTTLFDQAPPFETTVGPFPTAPTFTVNIWAQSEFSGPAWTASKTRLQSGSGPKVVQSDDWSNDNDWDDCVVTFYDH
jgi:hypothetical protein